MKENRWLPPDRFYKGNQWLRPCGGEPYPVMKGIDEPWLKTTLIRRPPGYNDQF